MTGAAIGSARSDIDLAAALRGAAWAGSEAVPYPRLDPTNLDRLPTDTWVMAQIPAGVRLELDCAGVQAVELDVEVTNGELGYRGAGAGTEWVLWLDGRRAAAVAATLGTSTVTLPMEAGARHAVVYLPEGMKPRLLAARAVGGVARPGRRGPRWLCYGDSIGEGWCASAPEGSWPVRVAREHGLDLVNLCYAGAARGEIVSAEHLAALPADVISLNHGTNCWSRTPHSAAQVRADYDAFLTVVRAGHPHTPIVAITPIVRPDAEETRNALGATLAELRATIADVVRHRQATDPQLTLVDGAPLVDAGDLVDGIHPGDGGHAKMAAALGPVLAGAVPAA